MEIIVKYAWRWLLVFAIAGRSDDVHLRYKHKEVVAKTKYKGGGLFETVSLIQCSIFCSLQNKKCFFYDKSTEWCSLHDDKHCNYHRGTKYRRTSLATVYTFQLNVGNQVDEDIDKKSPATQPQIAQEATHTDDLEQVRCNHKSRFYHACVKGKLDVVEYILVHRLEDINCRGKWGRTPVMGAARKRHFRVFNYLVRHGCDLSAVDDHNNNVLHLACMGGNVDIVRKLIIVNKFDIERKGKFHRGPIMWAARFGHTGVVELLLEKGGDPRVLDDRKENILHMSCIGGHVDMVRYILSLNIFTIESRGYAGRTPVMAAAAAGRKHVFDFLARAGCDMRKVNEANNNILHLACSNGHVGMARHILSQKIVSIESRGFIGRTPLMSAVAHGQKKVFDFLVKKGCNLKAVNYKNNNILHLSCYNEFVDMVKHILSQNIFSIDTRGQNGWTPVMHAVFAGSIKIFDFLNCKNCSLTVLDNKGNTILHVACMGGKVRMVKHLMAIRVVERMEKMRNKYGHTPVQVAAKEGHMAVFRFLKRLK